MFEYSNDGLLGVGGFLIVFILFGMVIGAGKAQHDGEKFTSLPVFIVMLLIIIGGIIYEAYESSGRANNSYEAYNSNKVIKCTSLTTTYLVSKDRGWSRYEDGFTKDDILLDIRSCGIGEDND